MCIEMLPTGISEDEVCTGGLEYLPASGRRIGDQQVLLAVTVVIQDTGISCVMGLLRTVDGADMFYVVTT